MFIYVLSVHWSEVKEEELFILLMDTSDSAIESYLVRFEFEKKNTHKLYWNPFPPKIWITFAPNLNAYYLLPFRCIPHS